MVMARETLSSEFYTLDSMIKGGLVRGLPVFKKPKGLWSTCISGKHAKCSFKASVFRAENPLNWYAWIYVDQLNHQH